MKTILKICDRCLCSKCGDVQCRKLACSICELDYPIEHCKGFLSEEKKNMMKYKNKYININFALYGFTSFEQGKGSFNGFLSFPI